MNDKKGFQARTWFLALPGMLLVSVACGIGTPVATQLGSTNVAAQADAPTATEAASIAVNPPEANVIADFLVIRDSSFEISATNPKTIQFDLPPDADLTGMAILAYDVRTSTDAQELKLEILLNGEQVDAPLFRDQDIPRSLWEAFNQDGLSLKLIGNVLELKISRGTGSLNIRDLVLWYHRRMGG